MGIDGSCGARPPASKTMYSSGEQVFWASMAAAQGAPVPTPTVEPFFNRRAPRRSSVHCIIVIIIVSIVSISLVLRTAKKVRLSFALLDAKAGVAARPNQCFFSYKALGQVFLFAKFFHAVGTAATLVILVEVYPRRRCIHRGRAPVGPRLSRRLTIGVRCFSSEKYSPGILPGYEPQGT